MTESLTIIYVIIRNKLVMRIFSHQQLLLVVPHHKLHIHHTGTWVSTPCSQQLGPVCMTGTEYIMLIRTTKLALSTDIFCLCQVALTSILLCWIVGNLYLKKFQTKIVSLDLGAEYLGFFSSRSLKRREKYAFLSQFVYFLREVCLLFNYVFFLGRKFD